MNKLYKVIEFDKILNKLSSYTSSDAVIERINNLEMLSINDAKQRKKKQVRPFLQC